jgi:hypothetical protein
VEPARRADAPARRRGGPRLGFRAGRTDHPEVRQLAEAIKNSQRAEIQTMQDMLHDRVGDSAEVELEPQNGSHTMGNAILTKSDGGVRVELS